MKAATPWITYRTRFLVTARQLTSSLSFTDALGRQQSGCKGDYLVESFDGIRRIASQKIFEDVYVPMMEGHSPRLARIRPKPDAWDRREVLSLPAASTPSRIPSLTPVSPPLGRKSPQPYRDRRSPTPGIRSL